MNKCSPYMRCRRNALDSRLRGNDGYFGVIILFILFLFGNTPTWAADALPAPVYFPILPLDASADTKPQVVPVATNTPLDGVHTGVTRAIIVIPEGTRDANRAVASLSALAGTANASTFILAPQFLLPSDIARFAATLPDKGKPFATWQITGWTQGDDSTAIPPQKGISSFTVVDLLLMYLSDRKAFPDLQIVTVAGAGAGANFVQRYAAFSLAANGMSKQNIDLRFLAAASSSYLYLTVNRPSGKQKGFGLPDVVACPDFNTYPYGLDGLNAYARHTGGNAAKIAYGTRLVVYLNAPVADAVPDTSCAAGTQGADSNLRALAYKQYLQSLYGDAGARSHLFLAAKDVKNDAVGLFGSVCGMAVLFGGGTCPSLRDEAR